MYIKVVFMTTQKLFLAACMALTLASCATSQSTKDYVVAKNYFVRNDARCASSVKITSQADFDAVFGMATHMGKDGRPTEIDFGKQFVYAKVMPVTDTDTRVRLAGVRPSAGKRLQIAFEVKQGEKQSYSIQPCEIVILDRKYIDYEIEEIVK